MTIRNLEHVLRPRSIAVVGASNDGGSVGEKLTANVLSGGLAGPGLLPIMVKSSRDAGRHPVRSSILAR